MRHDDKRKAGHSRSLRRVGVSAGLVVGWGPLLATPLLPAQQAPAAAPAVPPLASAAAPLVFDGVTVVDVEHGTLHPGQRVVIVGTRIQAIGDTGQGAGALPLPAGARVVDAQGEYLIPGLWDMHVHPRADIADIFYPLFVANGITGFRDAHASGRKALALLDSTVVKWHRILAGTLVGPPRQLLAGEPLQWRDAGGGTLADRARELKAHGANFLKVYPFTFDSPGAARAAGLPFGGHVDDGITAIQASDSGQGIIDHLNSSGGLDTLCWGSQASVARCQPTADRLRQNGTWFVPTFVAYHTVLSFTNPRSTTVFACANAGAFAFMAGKPTPGNWLQLRDSARAKTRADSGSGTLALAQRLDLPILAGTDAFWQLNAWMGIATLPGFSLHGELALLVAEGLTPLRALQAATLNPAKLIHGTDSLGTVAAGKLADLVLLDANPLEDITNTTAIRAVVANGRYFDRTALDSVLAKARANLFYWGMPLIWTDGAGNHEKPCGEIT